MAIRKHSSLAAAAQEPVLELVEVITLSPRPQSALYILPRSKGGAMELDALDVDLLTALRTSPRAGVLELSRTLGVARGTVQARLDRMERIGVVTGYGPDVDLAAAGYPVQAFASLEIAQGKLDDVAAELAALPAVLEAYSTTGSSDVLCRLGASSQQDLQDTLLALGRSPTIARSTSVVVLSVVVAPRTLPLLAARPRSGPTRAPAYRD
jgi:DNA-binding Lrp family transcriptional regulator